MASPVSDSLDMRLLALARRAGHTRATETAVRRFSALGEHGALWIAGALAGAALDGRRRGRWTRAAKGVAAAYVLNTAIKQVVRRRRPDLPNLPQLTRAPTQLSFPSAHAATSFAGARALSALVPGAPLYVVAAGLAASRVWLGMHYPSDIAAGALLGLAVGSAAR